MKVLLNMTGSRKWSSEVRRNIPALVKFRTGGPQTEAQSTHTDDTNIRISRACMALGSRCELSTRLRIMAYLDTSQARRVGAKIHAINRANGKNLRARKEGNGQKPRGRRPSAVGGGNNKGTSTTYLAHQKNQRADASAKRDPEKKKRQKTT